MVDLPCDRLERLLLARDVQGPEVPVAEHDEWAPGGVRYDRDDVDQISTELHKEQVSISIHAVPLS
jgi:hypothetical protein